MTSKLHLLLPVWFVWSNFQATLAQPSVEIGESSFGKDVTGEESESFEMAELKKMLDSDEDQIIIWVVQDREPVQVDPVDFGIFKSNRTYLIIKGKTRIKSELWHVFYWIGKESSDTDAGDVASFAVLLDAIVHSTVNIRREPEGHESSIFKTTFARDEIKADLGDVGTLPSETRKRVEVPIPKMYLIKGKDEVRFKPIELSLEYAKDPENCLVFSGNTIVYVLCGKNTTEPPRSVAKRLANSIIEKKKPNAELVIIERRSILFSDADQAEKTLLSKFAHEFDDIPEFAKRKTNFESIEFQSTEVMNKVLDEQFVTKDDIEAVIRIHEENNGVVRDHPVEEKSVPLSALKTDDCYVIHTRTDVSLLVWMGTKSEIDEREESARKAELYLRANKLAHETPVNFVDEEAVTLPTETHLSDFIYFMKQLNEPVIPKIIDKSVEVSA